MPDFCAPEYRYPAFGGFRIFSPYGFVSVEHGVSMSPPETGLSWVTLGIIWEPPGYGGGYGRFVTCPGGIKEGVTPEWRETMADLLQGHLKHWSKFNAVDPPAAPPPKLPPSTDWHKGTELMRRLLEFRLKLPDADMVVVLTDGHNATVLKYMDALLKKAGA